MAKVIRDILFKGRKILDDDIKQEARDQGLYNTGEMERSLQAVLTEKENLESLKADIIYYAKFGNDGFPARSASMKQFPFVFKYFLSRGFDERKAKQLAGATIHKWIREGMHTQGSRRFSKSRRRFNFIYIAVNRSLPKADKVIVSGIDAEIRRILKKVQSITI